MRGHGRGRNPGYTRSLPPSAGGRPAGRAARHSWHSTVFPAGVRPVDVAADTQGAGRELRRPLVVGAAMIHRAEAAVDSLVAGLAALVLAAFVVMVAGSALGLFARTPSGDAEVTAS